MRGVGNKKQVVWTSVAAKSRTCLMPYLSPCCACAGDGLHATRSIIHACIQCFCIRPDVEVCSWVLQRVLVSILAVSVSHSASAVLGALQEGMTSQRIPTHPLIGDDVARPCTLSLRLVPYRERKRAPSETSTSRSSKRQKKAEAEIVPVEKSAFGTWILLRRRRKETRAQRPARRIRAPWPRASIPHPSQ